MNFNCAVPLADKTTVIDAVDRGELDDYIFPADIQTSLFSPEYNSIRTLPFSTSVEETVARGSTTYGGTMTFNIDSRSCGDLLLQAYVAVDLDHWLPEDIRAGLNSGHYRYVDESGEPAWTYVNSMGTALIEWASLQVDEYELERIDGDYCHVYSVIGPSRNTQYGVAIDGLGVHTPQAMTDPRVWPTLDGRLACVLPFSFGRARRSAAWPLASVRDGSVRVVVKFRPFSALVQRVDGAKTHCDDTPLDKSYTFLRVADGSTFVHSTAATTPHPRRVSLITYSAYTTGKLRNALMRSPYEKIYRELYTYRFEEPLKYAVMKTADAITIQLPLELNHPCEELFWFVRRRESRQLNEWTNYGSVPWHRVDPVYRPAGPLLVRGALYINGQPVVEEDEAYFRRTLALHHKGGIAAYNKYIYGYCFGSTPGGRQPSGHINMSRAQDVKLVLTVGAHEQQGAGEWEVVVYAHCMNWLRFENGLVNRLFSS
jgi:hypothetical protein